LTDFSDCIKAKAFEVANSVLFKLQLEWLAVRYCVMHLWQYKRKVLRIFFLYTPQLKLKQKKKTELDQLSNNFFYLFIKLAVVKTSINNNYYIQE